MQIKSHQIKMQMLKLNGPFNLYINYLYVAYAAYADILSLVGGPTSLVWREQGARISFNLKCSADKGGRVRAVDMRESSVRLHSLKLFIIF